jgi:sugar lactone lactonase YvrE
VAVGGVAPDEPPPPPGPVPRSTVVRVEPGGKIRLVADIGAFIATHPDPNDLDQPPAPTESNPNGLALLPGGDVLVADAAANVLLRVDVHGSITLLARFKPELVPWGLPFGPPIGTPVPAEAVPTAVAVGPDGAYYVSELTGFPFSKGAARIWRVAPDSVNAVCDPANPSGGCSSVATGFSSVIDLAFGPDGTMYVLELAKNGLAGALVLGTEFPPTGALWAVKNGVKTLVSDSLVAPGGVAVDNDGGLFVTTLTFGPPGGGVISIH